MNRTVNDLAISFFGLITSAITIGLLIYMELHWQFALYSVMHLFVIPTGAIIAGGVAASGYYFGALWTDTKPTKQILLNMLLVSVGAYFSLNYLTYILWEIEGMPVADLVSFPEYMELTLTSMSLQIGSGGTGETGELGQLGYGVAVLQIVGFAIGGIAAYGFLLAKPFCDECNKYYKKIWKLSRFSGDGEGFVEQTRRVAEAFDLNDIELARERHAGIGDEKDSKGTHLKADLILNECPTCNRRLLTFEAYKQKGADWSQIDELSFSTSFSPPSLEGAAG